ANEGKMPDTDYITKIKDASGKTIVTAKTAKPKRVVTANTAKNMTSMLIGVFEHGTGQSARPAGYTLAGKTGTTESAVKSDSADDRDKWIVGYTPDVVEIGRASCREGV